MYVCVYIFIPYNNLRLKKINQSIFICSRCNDIWDRKGKIYRSNILGFILSHRISHVPVTNRQTLTGQLLKYVCYIFHDSFRHIWDKSWPRIRLICSLIYFYRPISFQTFLAVVADVTPVLTITLCRIISVFRPFVKTTASIFRVNELSLDWSSGNPSQSPEDGSNMFLRNVGTLHDVKILENILFYLEEVFRCVMPFWTL